MGVLKNKKGQALVEFALIIPLLLMILVGIMEFAMILSNQLIIESASREGARFAVLDATDSEIRTYVFELTDTLNGASPIIVITPSYGSRVKGVAVTVTITYQHTLMTPIISDLLGNQIQLRSSTTMRME